MVSGSQSLYLGKKIWHVNLARLPFGGIIRASFSQARMTYVSTQEESSDDTAEVVYQISTADDYPTN